MPKWDVNFSIRVQSQLPEIVSLVAQAQAFASVIQGIPITPRTKEKLDALNISRAVRGTTGIEGAELTGDEVLQIMKAPRVRTVLPPNRRREEQEARNAAEVMYYIATQLTKKPHLPLTEGLICKIHEITTQGIDYPNNVPGECRNHAVTAGNYVPPQTGEEVRRLMREFVRWFNSGFASSWDPIIKAIVAHFYVVSIHPFGEGNGRTSRAIESFLLYQAGVTARGFYSLANYYYRLRAEYIQYLDHVRFATNGDLTPFVLFALQGLVQELKAVHSEVLLEVQEIAFRDFARETLMRDDRLATKAGDRMFHFLLGLGREPVSLKDLREGKHRLSHLYRRVTRRTLSRDLNFLNQNGLVIIDGDSLQANLEIMTQYTPPTELRRSTSSQAIP